MNPTSSVPYYNFALYYLENGNKASAEEYFRKAVATDPNDAQEVQQQQTEAAPLVLDVRASLAQIPVKIRLMVVAFTLYYWNVPLSRIAEWMGVSPATVLNWTTGLAVALYPMVAHWIVTKTQAACLAVDEKWLKIDRTWHYWFVGVDEAAGLHGPALHPHNVGLCLDTFHLWTGGTPWDEVAALDRRLVAVAHLSDVTPRKGDEWSDDDRDVLPGDGILPLQEGIQAIRATGYDDLWCVEMMGAYHWEWDPFVLAQELKDRADRLLRS